MPITAFDQRLGQAPQPGFVDPAVAPRDFLRAGNFQSLAVLKRGDELAGFEQTLVRAGVEPSVATTHDFDVELALLKVQAIQVGDFELTAR